MSKLIISVIILAFLVSCTQHKARNEKELVDMIHKGIPNPKSKYKLDIKTEFKDNSNFKHIKDGLIDLIEADAWGEIVEFGEDYAVWIENYSRYSIDSNIKKITFNLSITKKSMWSRKNNILSKKIELEYNIGEDWLNYQKDADENKLFKALDNTLSEIKIEGDYDLIRNIVNIISKSVKNARSEFDLNKDDVVEHYVVAGYTYIELKKMMLELDD